MEIQEVVITFAVTRAAIAGERVLLAAGLKVRVMSRPAVLGDGCGICLRVAEGDRERAVAILGDAQVEAGPVYWKRQDRGGTIYRLVE